jgi:hypothetical protein
MFLSGIRVLRCAISCALSLCFLRRCTLRAWLCRPSRSSCVPPGLPRAISRVESGTSWSPSVVNHTARSERASSSFSSLALLPLSSSLPPSRTLSDQIIMISNNPPNLINDANIKRARYTLIPFSSTAGLLRENGKYEGGRTGRGWEGVFGKYVCCFVFSSSPSRILFTSFYPLNVFCTVRASFLRLGARLSSWFFIELR